MKCILDQMEEHIAAIRNLQRNFDFYPVRNNAPLGFESRYSGTGISNGVYSKRLEKLMLY
jgi:hypothetical protein